MPRVTGPVPATATPGDASHNYPFFSTTQWLEKHGYREDEFEISGMAAAYIVDRLQTHNAAVAPGGPYPYRTRVIVRRPKSARQFNGTVILEWINVTPMHDFEIDWSWSHEHLMQRGFAGSRSGTRRGMDRSMSQPAGNSRTTSCPSRSFRRSPGHSGIRLA
jgi:hypothetical protein